MIWLTRFHAHAKGSKLSLCLCNISKFHTLVFEVETGYNQQTCPTRSPLFEESRTSLNPSQPLPTSPNLPKPSRPGHQNFFLCSHMPGEFQVQFYLCQEAPWGVLDRFFWHKNNKKKSCFPQELNLKLCEAVRTNTLNQPHYNSRCTTKRSHTRARLYINIKVSRWLKLSLQRLRAPQNRDN